MGESHTVQLNTVPETPDCKVKKRKILQELTQAQVTIPETQGIYLNLIFINLTQSSPLNLVQKLQNNQKYTVKTVINNHLSNENFKSKKRKNRPSTTVNLYHLPAGV